MTSASLQQQGLRMPPTTPHIRVAVAAGLVTVLAAAGPVPLAYAAVGDSTGTVLNVTDLAADAPKSAHDKLGSADADLLAEAKADGDRTVTMMIATAPGQTEQVARQLDALKGGSVGRADDRLGHRESFTVLRPSGQGEANLVAAMRRRGGVPAEPDPASRR